MSLALPARTTRSGLISWSVLGLGLALLAANGVLYLRGRSPSAAAPPAEAPSNASPALPSSVTLAEGKLKHAGIATAPAELTVLPAELGVPGRIEANQDLQLQVRPRASGVIRSVHVALGQKVEKGQLLCILDSADVGTARLSLRAKQRELATARTEAAWKKLVADNVAALIPELRKGTETSVLEKKYADRPLGTFRSTLIGAYSEFDIAAHEEEKTGGLRRERIIGEHPAFVAKHVREGAQAKFEAVLDQVKYDANYQSLLAIQQVKLAEGAVADDANRLSILGVTEDVEKLIAQADHVADAKMALEDVTAYRITAPFAATVILKTPLAVPSQKAEVADVLFGLADLSTVWVMANVPESDFALLPALNKGTIRLSAAAYPDRPPFNARLLSIGATVDPTTRTVPMLAETPNPDGLLKLGMFVRIILDTASQARVLTVPASAVVDIDGQKGAFLPESKDGRTFAFRHLDLGRESGGRRVVLAGLKPGETVVSQGTFMLKSEIILQNEGDEE